MVFQTKETGNTGKYSFDKFMEIFKELYLFMLILQERNDKEMN